MDKLNEILDMAEQEAQTLIDNPTKPNAATCEMIIDIKESDFYDS